jgi:hypothetical protein
MNYAVIEPMPHAMRCTENGHGRCADYIGAYEALVALSSSGSDLRECPAHFSAHRRREGANAEAPQI